MKVRYTPRAFADREAIFGYLDKTNPQAAREVKAFLAAQIDGLSSLPERHPLIKELGVRVLWLGRYPYFVYYRIQKDEIAVLHIRHAARRPWAGGE
jgi:plasmid stabilization system protein ParE